MKLINSTFLRSYGKHPKPRMDSVREGQVGSQNLHPHGPVMNLTPQKHH